MRQVWFSRHFKVAALLAAALLYNTGVAAQLPEKVGDAPVPSMAPIVKKASPAVVNIATRGTVREQRPRNPLLEDPFFRRFFDAPELGPRERQFQSAGSGVIVDAKNGYIITNAHVIENADEITVTLLDDRQVKAEIVGRDKPSDVAVLKVPAKNLTEMPLADSSKAEVGDFVLAIGNPFALNHTVTSGIISALGRSDNNPESYQDFIQTDAPINPGNSGGALVDLKGQLVGINTAIFSGSGGNIGIGFAIPSNMVKAVMSQLVQYGEVKRGMLGVQLSNNFTPGIAENLGLENARGALVSQVIEGSPADKAGIKAGDVITSINGRNVANAGELRNTIGLLRIGEKVELGLIRDGKPRRVSAVIGERDSANGEGAAQIHPALEGAALTNAANNAGVLVENVADGSPAQLSGLRANDIILAVGRVRVTGVDQLRQAVNGATAFALTIRRGNSTLVFTIQ
ncbi:Do family serine endopeptidase [Steroidobacter sp. S1-65]|uniref:Do family serine endopeptidase n=1 Tax=Steroidobacter gossypii TaxID=2805490 RepID=A0ABS1X367_9GAMM|nr:Do family serine endopeptidase [Steroidobacter gossypii]MBM0107660.1 Do family serine endopeptidase [Steroidobacter gossypii]